MLELKNISVTAGKFSLEDISMKVGQGEYVILAGPSVAGKTMLLETISGLRKIHKGSVNYKEHPINDLGPEKRPSSLLFQNLAQFPHMNVEKNIGYAISKSPGKSQKVKQLTQDLSIGDHLDKKILELSGGEKQRVALARALASGPELLLLDEPLASLDNRLKAEMIMLLHKINQNGQTIIHVTHDASKAMVLATRPGIMKNGRLRQFVPVREILENPGDRFTAAFAGFENILPATFFEKQKPEISKNGNFAAFKQEAIQTEKCRNCLELEGRLIRRASGHTWLENSGGFLSVKADNFRNISDGQDFVKAFLDPGDILWLPE